MSAHSVLIWNNDDPQLCEKICEQIPKAKVTLCNGANDVCSNADVIVWYADGSDGEFARLMEVSDQNPLASVLVIGEIFHEEAISPHFAGMLFLGNVAPNTVAEDARRSLQASWWWGVKDFDVPILVVDEEEHIIRANGRAEKAYGLNLIGEFYNRVIEGGDNDQLPGDHPIRDVFEKNRSVNKQREFSNQKGDTHRVQLICRPVRGLDSVRAVTVMVLDMDRWAAMTRASATFTNAESLEELYVLIANEVQRLGYKRSRVYRYNAKPGSLKGCASLGFDYEKEAWFRNQFQFELNADPPSQETMKFGNPRLYLRPGKNGNFPGGVLPNHYPDYIVQQDPKQESELEMQNVNRWIEARLTVPAPVADVNGSTTNQPLPWGKISVDNWGDSDALDASDVTTIALYAEAASSAIASVQRLETDRRHLEVFKKYSRKLASLRGQGPDKPILENVVNLLLNLYLEITGADVVFFRELHHGDVLRLRYEPQWRDGNVPSGCEVPKEKRKGEGVTSEILEKRLEPKWGFDNNAFEKTQSLANLPNRWTDSEKAFLNEIGSEAYIPVVVHRNLRGVIVAVTWERQAFSSALTVAVERLMHTVGLWFELGELHDERAWTSKVMGDLIERIPDFANVPDDDRFFAALAGLLSAHDGVGWNRVFIFSCLGIHPQSAELVYALGGCGESVHGDIQNAATDLLSLNQLIQQRLENPVPGSEEGEVDRLYEMCVLDPRQAGKPILIPFGADIPISADNVFWAHPIQWMLERDYSEANSSTVPWVRLPDCPWFDEMTLKYPGMFLPAKRYAFPLRCPFASDQKAPFGIVVVEITDNEQRPVEQMLPVTRILLSLASDILQFRRRSRLIRGWLAALPTFRHRGGLKEKWDNFQTSLHALLEKVPVLVDGVLEIGGELEVEDIIEELKTCLKHLESEVGDFVQAKRTLEIDDVQSIPDLGAHLDELANAWEGRKKRLRVIRDWEAIDGISLQCDPVIFDETIRTLFTNALEAANLTEFPELHIRISAELLPSSSTTFSNVLELYITDSGPGIDPGVAKHIFLEGFSHHTSETPSAKKDASNKGRGLSLARAQLIMYHGGLELEHPGPQESELSPTGKFGATFVLRFGIPRKTRSLQSVDNKDLHDGEASLGG